MYTSDKKPGFDSVSLVELVVQQAPMGGAPHMLIKMAYVDSKTGHTYGEIPAEHNPASSKDILGAKTLEAWKHFCECLEKDQGHVIYEGGTYWDPQLDMFGEGQGDKAETPGGLKLGLGGGT